MFSRNIGSIDRILRIVVGTALVAAFFLRLGTGQHWLYLIGVVPLVTGLLGNCPAYSIFGISTCGLQRR